MGWDFHHEDAPYDRRSIVRSEISDRYEVLKDTVVGTTYYGALKDKATGEVHALVVLTAIHKEDSYNFGMKWMDETVGPYACDCPESILKLLSPTDNEWANRWRADCRAKRQARKANVLLNAPLGAKLRVTLWNGEERTVVKMAPAHQFKTWWLLRTDSYCYVKKNHVKSAMLII